MDIECNNLTDRRIAASDETISGAGRRIYARRAYLSGGTYRYYIDESLERDRETNIIKAVILHQTAVAPLLPPDPSSDSSAVDRIAAHFVVLNNGEIFYTHDVEFKINSAGGRHGIDIEFSGTFSSSNCPPAIGENNRLSCAAILAGRNLVRELKRQIPSITHIHPHGQVQKFNMNGERCGPRNNPEGRPVCGKLDSCPGPDIWVNVGEWAEIVCGLITDPSLRYYTNNGISRRQSNNAYYQRDCDEQVLQELASDLLGSD